jgi:hypothetical protein
VLNGYQHRRAPLLQPDPTLRASVGSPRDDSKSTQDRELIFGNQS